MSGIEWTRGELWPWLLLLPVVFALCHWLFARAIARAARYGASASGAVPHWRALRITALIGLGFTTWMDPRLGDVVIAVERRGLDIVFCLDVSRSMLASDMVPSRLERAQRDIAAVLPHLVGGDRAGLILFAGEARLWIPLTHDVGSFRGLLEEVDTEVVKVGGTDLAAALRKAGELIDPEQVATTVVVLLTDGEDLAGAGRQAAAELRDRGVIVHTVGYGSALGSKITISTASGQEFLRDRSGQEVVTRLDPESLRAVAAVTGGEFLRAEAIALPVVELHAKRLLPMHKRAYEAGEEVAKQTRYQWLLLPLLVLLLLEIALAGGRHG